MLFTIVGPSFVRPPPPPTPPQGVIDREGVKGARAAFSSSLACWAVNLSPQPIIRWLLLQKAYLLLFDCFTQRADKERKLPNTFSPIEGAAETAETSHKTQTFPQKLNPPFFDNFYQKCTLTDLIFDMFKGNTGVVKWEIYQSLKYCDRIFCGDILVRYWGLKLSLKVKGAICYFRPFARILSFTGNGSSKLTAARLRQMRRSRCVWKGPNLMPAGSINCLKSSSCSIMGFLFYSILFNSNYCVMGFLFYSILLCNGVSVL